MKTIQMKRPFGLLAGATALVLALGACSTFNSDAAEKSRALDLACPRVETPAPLAMMTQNGTGTAPASPLDLGVTASLRIAKTDCQVDDEDGTVSLDVTVQLTASKGPALKSADVKLPFFAAALDNNGNLLNKKLYETTFDFEDEITDREELSISFIFTKAQAASGRVIIGYQLAQDAWNAVKADGEQ